MVISEVSFPRYKKSILAFLPFTRGNDGKVLSAGDIIRIAGLFEGDFIALQKNPTRFFESKR